MGDQLTPRQKDYLESIRSIVKSQKEQAMEFLLTNDHEIDVIDIENNRTAIHEAFYCNAFKIIQMDIIFNFCKLDTNFVDNNGLSHFHIACAGGNVEAVKCFLKRGENINMQCSDNWEYSKYTPLHFAIKFVQFEVVELLLTNGADIKIVDGFGKSLVHLACLNGELIKRDFNAMSDNKKYYFLNQNMSIMKLLIEHGCSVNVKDNSGATPLFDLFNNEYYSIVREKKHMYSMEGVNIGLFISKHEHTSRYVNIIRNNQKEKLKLLFEHEADLHITMENGNALHWIIETLKQTRRVELDYDIYFDDELVLEMVDMVLKKGINVNAVNNENRTPLQYAVHYWSVDIVEILLKHEADITNIKLNSFSSAFRYPDLLPSLEVIENSLKIIELLEDKGFELSPSDYLLMVEFFIHNNDLCRLHSDNPNLYQALQNLLCYGSPVNVARSLNRMMRDMQGYNFTKLVDTLHLYMNFYVDKRLVDLFKIEVKKPLPSLTFREIELMKNIVIHRNVTLYNILQMNPHYIYPYLKNGKYRDILKINSKTCIKDQSHPQHLDICFDDNFCIFGPMIRGHFAKALIRRFVINGSLEYMRQLLPINLPQMIYEKILNYVDNEDIYSSCCAVLL